MYLESGNPHINQYNEFDLNECNNYPPPSLHNLLIK